MKMHLSALLADLRGVSGDVQIARGPRGHYSRRPRQKELDPSDDQASCRQSFSLACQQYRHLPRNLKVWLKAPYFVHEISAFHTYVALAVHDCNANQLPHVTPPGGPIETVCNYRFGWISQYAKWRLDWDVGKAHPDFYVTILSAEYVATGYDIKRFTFLLKDHCLVSQRSILITPEYPPSEAFPVIVINPFHFIHYSTAPGIEQR